MNLQQLKKEAAKLSVIDRLPLVEAMVQSLADELEPRLPVPAGVLERLRGSLKTDAPPLNDAEIQVMLEECLEEKYL